MKFRELFPFRTDSASLLEMKDQVNTSCARSIIIYGNETRPLLADVGLLFVRVDMQMTSWIVSLNDRNNVSEEFSKSEGVDRITTVLRGNRLGWYGHVMRKNDKKWVKFLVIIVDGSRHVRRPIKLLF